MSKIIERVSLYYRDGRSDKVYVIELTEEAPGKYLVIGYNGRRGTQLVAQPKTSLPVTLTEARRIFNNLEQAKLNHSKTPYKIAERQSGAPVAAKSKESALNVATATTDEADNSAQPSSEDYRANHLDALEF